MVIAATATDRLIPASTCVGRVVSVRGNVVDCEFEDRLPAIRHILRTGADDQIALEVARAEARSRARL